MKIKVIDLLNKIANGEEIPKKIKIQDEFIFELSKDYENYYYNEYLEITDLLNHNFSNLNDEVEILEEDNKIEYIEYELIAQCDNWLKDERGNFSNLKLNQYLINCIRKNTEIFGDKINEIIDEINKLKGEK